MFFQLLILALALSIDSFGIGVSYGIRKIDFKKLSLLIISFMSFSFSLISIKLGSIVTSILSEKITLFISVFILIVLGLLIIKKGVEDRDSTEVNEIEIEDKKIYSLFLKPIGITIDIIKTPSLCDLNKSSHIEPKEAIYLGVALSIDCIATSFAVSSFKSYTLLFPIFVVLFQLTFLLSGVYLGKKAVVSFIKEDKISICSGIILIVIGFVRLVFN